MDIFSNWQITGLLVVARLYVRYEADVGKLDNRLATNQQARTGQLTRQGL